MHFAKILPIVAVMTAALVMSSMASPAPSTEHEPERFEELELYGRTSGDESLVRLKRATCDLGSFSSSLFTPNHALCAGHCILLGKRGGKCEGTVCHCRA